MIVLNIKYQLFIHVSNYALIMINLFFQKIFKNLFLLKINKKHL
jgi:hypothetical protein